MKKMILTDNMIAWLARGERGASSNTIFQHLTGHDTGSSGGFSHPHDPDDVRRCRKLLDQCPELKATFPQMATRSPVWAALVAEWGSLCAEMDFEAPDRRDHQGAAPIAYRHMKAIIERCAK